MTLPLQAHSIPKPSPFIFGVLVLLKWIRNHRVVLLCTGCALLSPILLPFVHLGVIFHLWDEYALKVNRKTCSCSCWDTVFKGSYENGIASYKHVYFNVTSNTMKIWAVTVIAVIALYETVKRTLWLLCNNQIRRTMFVLLISIIYPHYYSWWSCFNYWNDDFYSQWNHQMFFSITELVSTLMVIHLMDSSNPVAVWKLIIIIDIALLHILASGFDQFICNVFGGQGDLHQVLRDIGFMVPDFLHVVIPAVELVRHAKSIGTSLRNIVSKSTIIISVIIILSLLIVCSRL